MSITPKGAPLSSRLNTPAPPATAPAGGTTLATPAQSPAASAHAAYDQLPTPAAAPSAVLSSTGGKAPASTMDLRMSEVAGPARTEVANLTGPQLSNVVQKKATCPFIGTAVQQGALPVRNNAETPLASISDVAALGNTGGGDLGELLKLFAKGNHSRMPAAPGEPAPLTPSGHFSLDFPGSQGSHPGHSGILQGDPTARDSGRLSQANMDRLLDKGKDGYLTTSEIGAFIADNLKADPDSKVLGKGVTRLLLGDVGSTVLASGPALLESIRNAFSGAHETTQNVKLYEKLTKTLGEDNLVGSAGEFGLLVAMLANSPNSRKIGGETAIRTEDVKAMFVDKKFPDGWETWPKTRHDWVVATTSITAQAIKHYHHLKD